MSRTHPDPAEEIMLRYGCDYCYSPTGVWCCTDTGRWYAMLHAARFWAATHAGDLPLKTEEKV